MAILDRVRDRRGVFIDAGDLADDLRKQANGFHPADLASDVSDGASDVAKQLSNGASDAAKQLSNAGQGAAEAAKDAVKDVSDTTRERVESLGDLLRDLAREWSRASSDMRLDEKVDDIAQRLRAAMPAATFKGAVTRLERELPDTDKDRYDRAYERGRVRTRSIYIAGGLAAGVAAGLVGAMLLDPQRGAARRARIAQVRSDLTRQLKDRSQEVAGKARAMAQERGIGSAGTVDPTGVTTGRGMVPVMTTGSGPVTDPSSTVLEPPPLGSGGIESGAPGSDAASTVDATADRAVTATHG